MAANKRIQKELQDITTNAPFGCSATILDNDLFHWHASITGPDASPYAGGIFQLDIRFPTDYPFRGPKINFTTKIFHVNISETGIICLEFLMEKWQPTMMISKVLATLRNHLSTDPELENEIDSEAAKIFKLDRSKYDEKVRDWTRQYALGDRGPE